MNAQAAVAAPIHPAPRAAAPSRRQVARAPFRPQGKHVVHEIEVLLRTEPATRVFESTMEPMRAATFLLEDALPRRARDESQPIDALLEIIDTKFLAVEKQMEGEVKRLELVAKEFGCQLPKRYVNSETKTVVMGYSPTFFRFIDLVLQLDVAMQWLDSLWMGRALKVKDRGETIVRTRNLLLHLCRELQLIKDRAIHAVERLEADRGKKMAARAESLAAKQAAKELRRDARRNGLTASEIAAGPASNGDADVLLETPSAEQASQEKAAPKPKPARPRAPAAPASASAELAPVEEPVEVSVVA